MKKVVKKFYVCPICNSQIDLVYPKCTDILCRACNSAIKVKDLRRTLFFYNDYML
jgi:DNA-directed RNA polymerase subunit RPC12/RpoP